MARISPSPVVTKGDRNELAAKERKDHQAPAKINFFYFFGFSRLHLLSEAFRCLPPNPKRI
jgi:hypothetical protein